MSTQNQQEIASPTKRVAKKRTSTQTITYTATLCSLCIVLEMVSNTLSASVPSWLKISLGCVGWFLAGIVLGPLYAGGVTILADVLGQFLTPTGGMPNPLLALSNGLMAVVFGFIYHYLPTGKLNEKVASIVKIIVGIVATAIIGTMGLNTIILWNFYFKSMDFGVYYLGRFVQLIAVAINIVITILLEPVVKNLGIVWTKFDFKKLKKTKTESEEIQ